MPAKTPELTIFTPAYNRAYTLPRTYEGMKQQKNTDFIWLIVDDGSTDNTAELVRQWQTEENGLRSDMFTKKTVVCTLLTTPPTSSSTRS